MPSARQGVRVAHDLGRLTTTVVSRRRLVAVAIGLGLALIAGGCTQYAGYNVGFGHAWTNVYAKQVADDGGNSVRFGVDESMFPQCPNSPNNNHDYWTVMDPDLQAIHSAGLGVDLLLSADFKNSGSTPGSTRCQNQYDANWATFVGDAIYVTQANNVPINAIEIGNELNTKTDSQGGRLWPAGPVNAPLSATYADFFHRTQSYIKSPSPNGLGLNAPVISAGLSPKSGSQANGHCQADNGPSCPTNWESLFLSTLHGESGWSYPDGEGIHLYPGSKLTSGETSTMISQMEDEWSSFDSTVAQYTTPSIWVTEFGEPTCWPDITYNDGTQCRYPNGQDPMGRPYVCPELSGTQQGNVASAVLHWLDDQNDTAGVYYWSLYDGGTCGNLPAGDKPLYGTFNDDGTLKGGSSSAYCQMGDEARTRNQNGQWGVKPQIYC
jgi:hypothetical protein